MRLAQRPYGGQWRGHADTKPPDPTNPIRGSDDKPVAEPIGVCLQFDRYLRSFADEAPKGGYSSGTDSHRAASAGGHEPTHNARHPEPHNESLGVRHPSTRLDRYSMQEIVMLTTIVSIARFLCRHRSSNALFRSLQILPLLYLRTWCARRSQQTASTYTGHGILQLLAR